MVVLSSQVTTGLISRCGTRRTGADWRASRTARTRSSAPWWCRSPSVGSSVSTRRWSRCTWGTPPTRWSWPCPRLPAQQAPGPSGGRQRPSRRPGRSTTRTARPGRTTTWRSWGRATCGSWTTPRGGARTCPATRARCSRAGSRTPTPRAPCSRRTASGSCAPSAAGRCRSGTRPPCASTRPWARTAAASPAWTRRPLSWAPPAGSCRARRTSPCASGTPSAATSPWSSTSSTSRPRTRACASACSRPPASGSCRSPTRSPCGAWSSTGWGPGPCSCGRTSASTPPSAWRTPAPWPSATRPTRSPWGCATAPSACGRWSRAPLPRARRRGPRRAARTWTADLTRPPPRRGAPCRGCSPWRAGCPTSSTSSPPRPSSTTSPRRPRTRPRGSGRARRC
mmetsp:Transcript_41317/g.115383  ORF Transcript_41317/g.115383 Transcript_41317/m.115383 type:complete len:396 (+) Transcript_41317:468-1655(+)